jgi:hypothetical protein
MTEAITTGRITPRHEAIARILNWLPLVSFFGVSVPAPIIFLVLFFMAATTEAAVLYLTLSLLAAVAGLGAAAVIVTALLLYRRHWLAQLREKLAADGITASEVRWFTPELTTAERKTLKQIKQTSPLLADAYSETLAARLMATRLIDRTKKDLLLVERRLNRVTLIQGADTQALQDDLRADRGKLETAKKEASARLAETQARMQMIEAAASRDLSHEETYRMLQRLSTAQQHLPLSIEMAQIERRALEEATHEVEERPVG